MTGSSIYSVVLGKLHNGPLGSVRGCESQPLRSAPFGDLVRVCYDFHDDRPRRDSAIDFAKFLLPEREGFRHLVFRESARSLIVFLAPNDDRDDKVIISVLRHSVRSLVGSVRFSAPVINHDQPRSVQRADRLAAKGRAYAIEHRITDVEGRQVA